MLERSSLEGDPKYQKKHQISDLPGKENYDSNQLNHYSNLNIENQSSSELKSLKLNENELRRNFIESALRQNIQQNFT